VRQKVYKLALRQEQSPAYPKSDFMDEIRKICEKHGLDKNIVDEIISCSSVKDESKRLKKINSLLEKL